MIVFVWLFVKAAALAFRLSWGVAKVLASLLMAIALPVLVVCLVFVGGMALMVPILVLGAAFAIVKACL